MIVNKYNKGGGGSGSGSTYTAGEYISIAEDVISVTGITPDAYLTSADTQDFVTEADVTAITSPIQSQLDDVERVTATAYTELHQDIVDLSGATSGYATQGYVTSAITAATQGLATEAYVTGATATATAHMVESSDDSVQNIIQISQADYNDLVSGGTVDNYTFYIITGSTS